MTDADRVPSGKGKSSQPIGTANGADPPRRRTGGRSARVHRSVLDAAIEVLADGGMAGFSIDEVAERAGVHKTTIYRRWGNPTDLVVEAVRERSEMMIPVPDTGSLHKDLMIVLDETAKAITSTTGTALVIGTINRAAPELEVVRNQHWTNRFSKVGEVIERGRDRGELRPDVDVPLLLEMLIAPLFFRVLMAPHLPINRRFFKRVIDLAVQGAGADPTGREGAKTTVAAEAGAPTDALKANPRRSRSRG